MPCHKYPAVEPATRDAIVSRLADATAVAEVAIGERTDVAAALAERGVAVLATDVRDRSVPAGVRFVRDDLTEPDASLYRGAEVVFAQNLPGELQRPALELAETVGADFVFTTLGAEEPVVPVVRETVPGETLYRAISGP
jgi:uncharacterized UPF0146 family protein